MVLRLKLRHALGEEIFELEARQDHQPHVIGRGGAATIEVPSLRAAPRHCALFVHQGRWVLQDGNTRSGTLVNGRFLPGSRSVWPLSPNDLIRLGDDFNGPVLHVEHVDVPEQGAPPPPPPPQPGRPMHPPGSRPIDATSAHLAAISVVEPRLPTEPEGPVVHWSSPAPRSASARNRTRPQQRMGPAGQLMLLAASLLVIGAGAAAYLALQPDLATAPTRPRFTPPAVTPTPPADPPSGPVPGEQSTQNGALASPAASPAVAHTEAASPTAPELIPDAAGLVQVLAGLEPDHPLRQEPQWQEMVEAHDSDSAVRRLLAYDRYLADRPDSPLGEVVRQWQEETLDELWWRRIRMLLDEEFALVDRQIELEAELRLLPAQQQATRAGELAREQRQIRQRLAAISSELAGRMAYESGLAPNLANTSQLQRLRLARDEASYIAWKQQLLAHVRTTESLPWEADGA